MAGRIRAEDVALVKERAAIADVVGEYVTLRRRGQLAQGTMPVPRREDPVVQRQPGDRLLPLLRLRRRRRRHLLPRKVEHLSFTEAVERLATKAASSCATRTVAGVRTGRHRAAQPAARGAPGGAGVLRRAAAGPRPRPGPDASSCARAASTGPLRAVRRRVRAARRRGAVGHLRGKGFSDDEVTVGGLAGRGSRGLYDRFRGPAGLADPRHHRRRRRLRRPAPLRRRPDRGQVPQHVRDADLPEVQRALRPGRWPRRRCPMSGRASSSRATPTSWPATLPASRPRWPRAARRSAAST